ncbi:putative flavin carrier protein 3 [Maudiozyma exigua]|uniref:Flavin carrier protein 3 n=1 Tax=Maudiozyma exigua TaxID=34358 RepID=A0A9P6W1E2_MAUEX|nr:putative flavin carrier protein 3 [Kazachstania exigua]
MKTAKLLLIQLLLSIQFVIAKRNLVATSLVTCMENSQLSSNSFDVIFKPDDRSLHYTLDLTTQIDSYILAYIDVYAYGFKIITKNFDVCSENWKQFCPVHPGNIEIDSIEYISKDLTDEIPGIAYNVPDIDAFAVVKVYSANTTEYLACIQVFFSNGKTVSQTGVKWATAVVAGIGLLLSAVLSTFGNSTAASHISANTMSLFLYFQSVAVVAMEHVHRVPPIAAAWSENLAWSMGLIRVTFMQKIFRWYVQSTGGTPSLYLTATTMSVLTQRAIDYTSPLWKRTENILYGNQNTLIFRGIKRLGYRMNIENTAIVCTGFTFFVLCGYVLAGFIMVCKYSFELGVKAGWINPTRFHEFRTSWRIILKGALLRYIYIGFTQLTILSFWEFTERDSGAVITIACLFIVLSVGLMGWALFRTHYFAQISIQQYNNPAAILYGDQRILHKYGFFYTMFNAAHYWWNGVLLSYIFVKSLFIGFAQASGKTQALAVFILDLFYFIAIIYYKPYLDKPTNIMNIFICTVTLVNSFLFMFFSDLFHQNYTVSAVMGWVFFIMNAAFSFILLMMILAFTLMIVCSKNPDLRFKPANDDRTSFQRYNGQQTDDMLKNNSAAKELLELGNVAKEHNANWQSDLFNKNSNNGVYRNKSFSSSANFIKRLSSFKLGKSLSRTSLGSNPFADKPMNSAMNVNTLSNLNTISNFNSENVTPSDTRLNSEINLGSNLDSVINNNANTRSTDVLNTSSDISDPFKDANAEKTQI